MALPGPAAVKPPRDFISAIAGRLATLGCLCSLVVLVGCDRPPPLPAELAAIRCPSDRQEHASATFATARVTFLCITKQLAKKPSLLRCDPNSDPMVCEDAGTMVFSRDGDGEVYWGLLPEEVRRHDASAPGLSGSRFTAYFRSAPPTGRTFDEADTNWAFVLSEAKDLLPSGFTFVKGALCDRQATALNSGGCQLEARSASLYWRIAVEIHSDRGTPVSAEQYREAMAFWLRLLPKLVEDPIRQQHARL